MSNIVAVIVFMFALVSNQVFAQHDEAVLAQSEVIEALANLKSVIDQHYLPVEKSERLNIALTRALKNREFEGHYPFGRLKRKLESLLFSVSHDPSFEILCRDEHESPTNFSTSYFPGAVQARMNANNLGYLAIDGDFVESDWQAIVDSSLTFVSGSDALIIDLRTAGHSSLSFITFLLGYFVPSGEPLAKLHLSHGEYLIIRSKGAHNPVAQDIPIFILTSPFLAGAWELFLDRLKSEGRATIIGKPTMGLSQLTRTEAISQHLSVTLPYAEILNPKNQDSWNNTGVLPDVESLLEDALAEAERLIGQTLIR